MTKFKFTIAAKIFSILAVIALFAFIMGIYSWLLTSIFYVDIRKEYEIQ